MIIKHELAKKIVTSANGHDCGHAWSTLTNIY